MTAWIVRGHNKTKTFRRRRQRGNGLLRQPDDQNDAPRRGAHAARALRCRHLHQFVQRRRVRVPKGKAKAAGERAVA